MSEDVVCPKCGQQMHAGFFANQMSIWIEGKPKLFRWLMAGVKNYRPVAAYRCTSCGFLEWYAK